MKSTAQKKKLLKNSRLYVILDKDICANNKNILRIARQIKKADIVQLRHKKSNIRDFFKIATGLRLIFKRNKILFIINDRVDVAFACNADGVHLGQDDILPKIAKRLLGRRKIVGLSCHSLKQIQQAQENPDVDYISIGPIFSTVLKPEYKTIGLKIVSKISKRINKPLFGIGGIDLNNIKNLLKTGIKRVCLCRAICNSDKIYEKTKLIKEILQNN